MSRIDGRVSGLNEQTLQTVRRVAQQSGGAPLNAAQVHEITTAAQAGGIDAAEADLLDELLENRSNIEVRGASGEPVTLRFAGRSPAAVADLHAANRDRLDGNITPVARVSQARNWTAGTDVDNVQSGVVSNRQINENYHNLDQRFSAYSHGAANWMTYGKYASREAGSQIANLEGAYEMLRSVGKGNVSSATEMADGVMRMFSSNGDASDFNPNLGKQGVLMVGEIMRRQGVMSAQDVGRLQTLMQNPTQHSARQAAEIIGANMMPLAAAGGRGVADMVRAVEQLRGGLVQGNTEIYRNVAPAFDTFLDAESRGQNGVEALRAAGYGRTDPSQMFATPANPDPQGFLIQAFEAYQQGREAFDKGDRAKGEELMHRGNLLIGCQEQMAILQQPTIFGDPQMKDLLRAWNGTMSLTDANGTHALLPNHGFSDPKGWADFETRMGIKPVPAGTPGAITVRTPPNNQTQHYVPRPSSDPASEGTISRYFAEGLTGTAHQNLLEGRPRQIHTVYSSVDLRYGDQEAQIGSSRPAGTSQYGSVDAALAAIRTLQGGSYLDKNDYAVVRNARGRFEVRDVTTQAMLANDISNQQELNQVNIISDRHRVAAIVSDGGQVRRF